MGTGDATVSMSEAYSGPRRGQQAGDEAIAWTYGLSLNQSAEPRRLWERGSGLGLTGQIVTICRMAEVVEG